ncbi:MAG: HEAT repeat domain-containing protein [Balneolaceae bacterium]|nr:HEAT repeat domain-containing protein [Balneolaceae bacterium]MBO6547189.1 HEAT repeat domain-containing protein [Balneolaceae bacterium]MBO6647864.1 HEAT repeat domain-containing protein [Balneolaceae bacterium]
MSEKNQKLIADYLQGTLDDEGKKQVEELIAKGDIDFIDFRAMEQLHDELDMIQVPEPSKGMSSRFYTMLEEEKENIRGSIQEIIREKLSEFLNQVTMPRVAYAFILLIVGGFVGNQMGNNDSEIKELTSEMQTMREMMMVSMLEGPSTTDRLKAVNISAQLPSVDQKAIRALLFTLNNDESINVRVQTIEALTRWGDDPMVREGFVKAIANQDDDIVIVTLADAMVELGVKNSANEFQRLIDEKDLTGATKQKVENTIAVLL